MPTHECPVSGKKVLDIQLSIPVKTTQDGKQIIVPCYYRGLDSLRDVVFWVTKIYMSGKKPSQVKEINGLSIQYGKEECI